jgi:AcrR family transcriptional regulator
MAQTRRQTQKAETRDALKQAALSCFSRQGMARTRVTDITRDAGTAAGTFYVHFESKEALLDELLADFNQGLVARLLPAWTAAGDLLADRLRASAEAFLDHWDEHRGFVEVYVQRAAEGLSLSQLRDGINPEAASLVTAALLEEARRRGGTLTEASLVGTALLALWARVGLQVLFGPEVTREAAVGTLLRLTLGALSGVLPPEGPAPTRIRS